MIPKSGSIALLFLLGTCCLPGQAGIAQDTTSGAWFRKSSFIPIPIVYYTPETRWAGGLAALYSFHFRKQPDSLRVSQIQLGAAYTQERQFLLYFPFQLFLDQEKIQISGEWGWYRYVYQFYGIGNQTKSEDQETYEVDFPRIRLNLLKTIVPSHYIGLRYWWDNYQITSIQEGGQLSKGNIDGASGGIISGLGMVWNYDTRDQLFYPQQGALVETSFFLNLPQLGSDFQYSRFSVDAVKYHTLAEIHTFAFHALLTTMWGEVPFQQLAFIGGPKKMRGFFEGRLRDKNLWMLQTAYRRPLVWRMGMELFAGVGNVAPEWSQLFQQQVRWTCGLGLKFQLSKKDKINLRLDLGINDLGETFPYLTVLEAF